MTVFRAAWICPIAGPPVKDGWVATEAGRIVAAGARSDPPPSGTSRDLGDVVILPGLVNAHTHLELSWLRGRVPPAPTFNEWVTKLMATRGRRVEHADDASTLAAAIDGAREARSFGTALVGDICNSLASVDPIRAAGMRGLVFHELLGFDLLDGSHVENTRAARTAAASCGREHVRVSVAPHAPYSVSPELFRAIRDEVKGTGAAITSIHVAESDIEVHFLKDGSGPIPVMLRGVGKWRDDWRTPGCDPVEYLDRLGVLDPQTLVVHGVQLDDGALARLAAIGCTLVTCPRSNQWVGAGSPPIARFYAAGVQVAIGTDSLASVDDLNLFAELEAMRKLTPSVPAATLLASATRVGAHALGFGDELGSIERGKRAELIAVDVPPQIDDVEEYLVSGITSSQIRWI